MDSITIIFFDIDDTLMDHQRAERLGALDFQQQFSTLFPQSAAEFAKRWHHVAEKHIDRYMAGEISWQDQRVARMQELFGDAGRDLSVDEALNVMQIYLGRYKANWSLFPDVYPCFQALSGTLLGIISNGDPTQQYAKLEGMDITRLFSTLLISGEIGKAKPDPEIFLEACRRAGQHPAHCCYIGDRLETDAQAACDAGLNGIWLDRKSSNREHADIVKIGGLSELPDLLKSYITD